MASPHSPDFLGACLRLQLCSALFFSCSIFFPVSRSSREIERLIKTERISSASVQPASSQRRWRISFSSAVNVASTFSLRLIFIPSVSEWPPKQDLEKSAEFFSEAKPLRTQSGTQLCLFSFPVGGKSKIVNGHSSCLHVIMAIYVHLAISGTVIGRNAV